METKVLNNNVATYASASSIAISLKKRFGSLISGFASTYSIDEDVLGGFILTESNGIGIVNGRVKIRFEFKKFNEYLDSPSNVFTKLDGVEVYCKNGIWKSIHATQDSEYEAFQLAKSINESCAYEAISMGLGQIMGFNCTYAGYDSAKEMYEAFSISETTQMHAFLNFIARYSNGGSLLQACRNRDFEEMARIYNGINSGYAAKIRNAAADYALA